MARVFSGQTEAALVVTQDAGKWGWKADERVVPALDATADLVDHHEGLTPPPLSS